MRVQCIETTGVNLSTEQKAMGYNDDLQFPIIAGNQYIVFGMTLWGSHIWYLIIGENQSFPDWMPDDLFIIKDSRISRHWYYVKNYSEIPQRIQGTWGYKDLTDDMHADKLSDKDKEVLGTFNKYRELMELEFADPENHLTGKMLDEQSWVMCPLCSEAWEVFSKDGMIRCPNCDSIVHNPFHAGY